MLRHVFDDDVKTMSREEGFIPIDVSRMRAASMRYSLEDVGRAMTVFVETSIEHGRDPTVADAAQLNDYPQARACFIEFVDAILPVEAAS